MSEEVIILEPKEANGVKIEVSQKIKKMLEKGVRYFGSSGASLTHQVYDPPPNSEIKPSMAKIGLEGERDTTLFLKDWMKDKPNAVLIDSVHINTKYGDEEYDDDVEMDEEAGVMDGKDTDHVLILGNHVILIDTKRWKSKRTYIIDETGQVKRGNASFAGGRLRMSNAIYLWLEYLHESAILNGIVLVNADEVKVLRTKFWYKQKYRLIEKERMKEFLDKLWEKEIKDSDSNIINSTLVAQVAVSAIKPYDNYKKLFNQDSLKSFK